MSIIEPWPAGGGACGCADLECQRYGCKLNRRKWNYAPLPQVVRGCICPPTSEQTCQAPLCPRKGYG